MHGDAEPLESKLRIFIWPHKLIEFNGSEVPSLFTHPNFTLDVNWSRHC